MSKRTEAAADDKGKGTEAVAEEKLSYEQARGELAEVVQKLESGGGTLEESLALWERGEHLAAVCQRWLDGAKAKLDAAAP
ncbi:exodeoxyribonuclease VII small subunit [Catellatospora vulcania]|uniref:exodeoxyribonuclease VII small subunit n=1 Tax=Catellatospora vulcania TaxID=1460450 RepID=UPI0012D418DD|nr:exodeoxyribonuclease VII small subunit [Catellatospora vulcania]